MLILNFNHNTLSNIYMKDFPKNPTTNSVFMKDFPKTFHYKSYFLKAWYSLLRF